MIHEKLSAISRARGEVRVSLYDEATKIITPQTPFQHNDILYDWGPIVARLLQGNVAYKLGGIYIEYQNVASPGTPVTPPAVARDDGYAYYDGLSGSTTVDFLRLPLTSSFLTSSDEEIFPQGNEVTFLAMTAGAVGANGKTFSDTVNSRVYGAALVAIPDSGDRTKDLVFSRFYLPTNQQIVKPAGQQIVLEWKLILN